MGLLAASLLGIKWLDALERLRGKSGFKVKNTFVKLLAELHKRGDDTPSRAAIERAQRLYDRRKEYVHSVWGFVSNETAVTVGIQEWSNASYDNFRAVGLSEIHDFASECQEASARHHEDRPPIYPWRKRDSRRRRGRYAASNDREGEGFVFQRVRWGYGGYGDTDLIAVLLAVPVASSPLSARGAPALRSGPFGMTAPVRRGVSRPRPSTREAGRARPVCGVKVLKTDRLIRAQRSSLAAGARALPSAFHDAPGLPSPAAAFSRIAAQYLSFSGFT